MLKKQIQKSRSLRRQSSWNRAFILVALLVTGFAAGAKIARADEIPAVRVREVVGNGRGEEPICSGGVFTICSPEAARRRATDAAKEEARYDAEDRCHNQHGGEVKYTSPGLTNCELFPGSVVCSARVRVRCEIRRQQPSVSDQFGDLLGPASSDPLSGLPVNAGSAR